MYASLTHPHRSALPRCEREGDQSFYIWIGDLYLSLDLPEAEALQSNLQSLIEDYYRLSGTHIAGGAA